MNSKLHLLLVALPLAALTACSSSSSSGGPTADAAASQEAAAADSGTVADASGDAPASVCGHPGDMGNALGVGRYCASQNDCTGGSGALICATADPSENAYFCTMVCNECSPAGFCGTGATCVCQAPGACGCTPNACSALFPDAGNGPCVGDAGTGGD